jgi:hypothetical protein
MQTKQGTGERALLVRLVRSPHIKQPVWLLCRSARNNGGSLYKMHVVNWLLSGAKTRLLFFARGNRLEPVGGGALSFASLAHKGRQQTIQTYLFDSARAFLLGLLCLYLDCDRNKRLFVLGKYRRTQLEPG